jgi:hypothetical protein
MSAMRKKSKGLPGIPKNFVISFRVNAQEWEALKQRSEDSGISLSNLLRSYIPRLMQEERRRL